MLRAAIRACIPPKVDALSRAAALAKPGAQEKLDMPTIRAVMSARVCEGAGSVARAGAGSGAGMGTVSAADATAGCVDSPWLHGNGISDEALASSPTFQKAIVRSQAYEQVLLRFVTDVCV